MAPPAGTSLAREHAALAKAASRQMAVVSTADKNTSLRRIAEILEGDQSSILKANEKDLEEARKTGLNEAFTERLTLTPQRIHGIASEVRVAADLPDPIGEMFDTRTLSNGMIAGRRRVPLGVIACIYESRPNVTVDVASLALKSGNACVLRGGKEAVHTNSALARAIHAGLVGSALPPDAVQVITDPDRSHVEDLLRAHDLIDLMIPRGGAGLIERVRDQATMPVVAGGVGVVHIYVDGGADEAMALEIVHNAKTRRYSICNAVDTVLVDRKIAPSFLRKLSKRWAGEVKILADDAALAILSDARVPETDIEPATAAHWDTEHLALRAGVAVVDGIDGALEHITAHGSGHSEAIVTEIYPRAMRFLNEVDAAAVYVNASTQFTDGAQFGLGAEVGISTQKMHARGPMGLKELTSYKWTVFGSGQVRPL